MVADIPMDFPELRLFARVLLVFPGTISSLDIPIGFPGLHLFARVL